MIYVQELNAIQDAYVEKYGTELRDDVSGDTSGDFKNLLIELLRSERPQTDTVDRNLANADAKKLYQVFIIIFYADSDYKH